MCVRVHCPRRYFDASAVVELWELLRPAVLSVSHTPAEAFQALGWFALFAPTNQINRWGPLCTTPFVRPVREGHWAHECALLSVWVYLHYTCVWSSSL